MDRLPTNHAIILENVNLGFDINKFHSQYFNIILLVILPIIIIMIMVII